MANIFAENEDGTQDFCGNWEYYSSGESVVVSIARGGDMNITWKRGKRYEVLWKGTWTAYKDELIFSAYEKETVVSKGNNLKERLHESWKISYTVYEDDTMELTSRNFPPRTAERTTYYRIDE